jgi:hypothetical protein
MTNMRAVPFAEFRAFLQRLGYVEKSVPKGRVFEHPEEGLLLFRSYQDHEAVAPIDLVSTRKFFDLRGFMEADDYDAQLLRADTPA